MIVTSNVSVDFPKYNWGINAGAQRELPENKEAQAFILATAGIQEVKAGTTAPKKPEEPTK